MPTSSSPDWENLRVFLAVAKTGSARQAASTLNLHYTSVIRRLEAFEKQIGTQLFHKSAKGFEISEVGKTILKRAENMEDEAYAIERLLAGTKDEIAGVLKVTMATTIASYLLIEEITQFQENYPNINLQLHAGHKFANLSRNEADVAIRVSDAPGDTLKGRRFGKYYEAVYAHKDYIKKYFPLTKNTQCRWLGWQTPEDFFAEVKESEFSHIQSYTQIDNEILLFEAVKSKMGIAYLPCFYADNVSDLVRVNKSQPIPRLDIWLLAHPEMSNSKKVQAFMAFFSPILRAKQHKLQGLLSN